MKKIDQFFDPIVTHHRLSMEAAMQSAYAKSLKSSDRSKEFATVRLGMGRQSGQSCYIARSATSHHVIFCANLQDCDIMTKRCSGFEMGCKQILPVRSTDLPEWKPFIIWIDDASVVDQADLDRIYERYAWDRAQFVLVG